MKKILAFVLAMIMVMAMSTVAFAADDTYSGSASTNMDVSNGSIPFTKSIVLFNTDGKAIREPNISFTYAVTPATVDNGTTVTDSNNVSVAVQSGEDGAFPNNLTLSFSDANTVTAPADGVEVEKTGNLTIDTSVFTHAGIYRYVITETADPTDVTTVGLDERTTDYKNTRYMDVYIMNGTNGLEWKYAVIFKNISVNDSITTSTDKTTGFEPGSTTYENDGTVDKYHTYNLKVAKLTTGDLADTTHDFPFEITLTNTKVAAADAITVDYANGNATYDGTAPTTVDISTTAVVLKPKMSSGDEVTITGIPSYTNVMVKETNDTYDKYVPSIKTQTGFTGLTLTQTTALDPLNGTTQLSAVANITAEGKIEIENNLPNPSPTGLVIRFAPYAIMLVAGVVLLGLTKKRKANED